MVSPLSLLFSKDVQGATDLIAISDMLEVELSVVLVFLVTESKIEIGDVLGGSPDELGYDPRDVQFCARNSIQKTITMMTDSLEKAFFAVISTSCLSLVN